MLCPEDRGHLDPVGLHEVKLNSPQLFVDDHRIANRIDCYHTIVYDKSRGEFVSFLRNTLIFGDSVPECFRGNVRAISRLAGSDLWAQWDTMPTAVLIPDQGDATRFYRMSTFYYGGIYWGFLEQFDEDPQSIEVELIFSRNGLDWQRLPGRPRIIPVGKPGTWDSGMVFPGDRVIEKDDQWWLYYSGHNGYHDQTDRHGSIGVLKFRKEGFVSIRAGATESYVVTRPLRWPGGQLQINACATGGSVEVRVTDLRRQTVDGFGYADGHPFAGDQVRHLISWRAANMADFKGRVIRLEFKLTNADLYALIASDQEIDSGSSS